MKRKRPIISLICAPHRGSFRGLIVFCLNKSVNERQPLDAGGSRHISDDLGSQQILAKHRARQKQICLSVWG